MGYQVHRNPQSYIVSYHIVLSFFDYYCSATPHSPRNRIVWALTNPDSKDVSEMNIIKSILALEKGYHRPVKVLDY